MCTAPTSARPGALVPEDNVDFKHELTCGFAARFIRFRARQLSRQPGFRPSDRDDLQQQLFVRVVERLPQFDPSQGCFNAYVKLIVQQCAANIRRDQQAQRRDRRRETSLSALVRSENSSAEHNQSVVDRHWHARLQGSQRAPTEHFELASDIRTLIDSLPPRLQANRHAADGDVARRDRPSTRVPSEEPAEAYHAKTGEYLTSHLLADFRRCPLLYHRKRLGLIPSSDDCPAYLVGRAAHTVILEGEDAFRQRFAVGGPVNPQTGQPYGTGTKAWAEWAQAQGKEVLTHQQHALVNSMAHSVRQHGPAQELLASGIAEGVVRAPYREHPCQIRMDWFDAHQGIVDLKTCDDLTWFESDARRYGYAYQLAFYRAVLSQVIGLYVPVYLIAVEKKEPFRCGVWRLSPEVLATAQHENELALERLRACQESGKFPTGYEEPRLFDYL
jgi:RNA polymerase sigma factor (sigma-70 family)